MKRSNVWSQYWEMKVKVMCDDKPVLWCIMCEERVYNIILLLMYVLK